MLLRPCAWAASLLLAASAVQANASASFLDRAQVASLVHPEPKAPVLVSTTGTPPGKTAVAGKSSATEATAKPLQPTPVDSEANGDMELASALNVRSFLTLVVGLTLVGWLQRRRSRG